MARPTLHAVEVDREALAAELAGAAADAELEESRAAAAAEAEAVAAAGHDAAAWRPATDFVMQVVAGQVCPNWELGDGDRAQLSAALSDVLDHYWPGGPNGVDNWHPLYRLLFAVGAVTVTRGFDWQRGQLKPLHAPKGEDDGAGETAERERSLLRGDDAERKDGVGFSIGGG